MALRDEFGRWLFEQHPRENWPGADPEQAPWHLWVERNQQEWIHLGGEILTHSPITPMYELVNWLVTLDDGDPRTVTFDQIINRARLALDAVGGPYEGDGEQD